MPKQSHRSVILCLVVAAFTLVMGCTGIGVRPADERTLFDNWVVSLNTGQDISPRSRQTLRQLDLENSYNDDPFKCYLKLIAATPNDAQPDQVFALAEMSYRFGRDSELQQQTFACQYYYLCAGYAYHYLFGLMKESQAQAAIQPASQPKLLRTSFAWPRLRNWRRTAISSRPAGSMNWHFNMIHVSLLSARSWQRVTPRLGCMTNRLHSTRSASLLRPRMLT